MTHRTQDKRIVQKPESATYCYYVQENLTIITRQQDGKAMIHEDEVSSPLAINNYDKKTWTRVASTVPTVRVILKKSHGWKKVNMTKVYADKQSLRFSTKEWVNAYVGT